MQINLSDWLENGFTFTFAAVMLVCIIMIVMNLPKLIKVWAGFNRAIEKNTEMTEKHYNSSVTVLEELRAVSRRLEKHDANAVELRENQEEILKIIREIEQKLSRKEH